MPSFSGKFQYLNPDGSAAQSGPCRVSFDTESLTLAPASAPPLVLDLGDIDIFAPADYALTLTLYTAKKILLQQFGKAFQNLSHDLLEAYRQRLVQCLLLEDLAEVARFDGFARLESPARAFSSPAEFRLYKTNLAVLPAAATGFQWRLADIDTINFDAVSYAVTLESAGERLTVTKLAKRTEEFADRIQDALAQLAEKTARTLRGIFPFLTPDQLQQVAQLMKEGHAASLAKLQAVHSKTAQALAENVVDAQLKPYFDALLLHTPSGGLYAGFKLLRREQDQETTREETGEQREATAAETPEGARELTLRPSEAESEEEFEAPPPEISEEAEPILHWVFCPLAAKPGAKYPANLVAWEATSKAGRATYFFRLVPPDQAGQLSDSAKSPSLIEAAIRQLNHAIVLLNFRREPIYLPDDALEMQPRFRRYAIACRKIPELGRLRASFLGRAIHTTPQAWQKQFESFLAEA
jgi:hypothetical protein